MLPELEVGCVVVAEARMWREKMEGCSVFGSSLVLFKVQMASYIRNLEFILLKIGYQGSL